MSYKRTLKRLALLAALALNSLTPARGQQAPVNVALPVEESMAETAVDDIVNKVTDERNRLLVRLQAEEPDQSPGTVTTSVNQLAGAMIANAMRHMLVVQPNDRPVMIAIAPQADPDGSRQLVLINLSAWIDHGRLLGQNQMETFAILPDAEMRQPQGSSFEVDGVKYVGKVAATSIAFHRAQ